MNDRKFKIGSRAFFEGMAGFNPTDDDTLILQDKPNGYNTVCQIHTDTGCIYYWKRMTAQEYIDYALKKGPAMQLGKFLVPEFAKEIGLTVDGLPNLRPIATNLDDKHKYESIILEAYINNGAFTLTDEQRAAAFKSYKAARTTIIIN